MKDLKVYKNGKVLNFPGKSLVDIPADLAGCPAVEYEYYGGYIREVSQDCYGWRIAVGTLGHSWDLVDSRGEKRAASADFEGIFKILSNYRSWAHFDEAQSRQELESLKKRLEELSASKEEAWKNITKLEDQLNDISHMLNEAYDINEKGGSGSRKKVRDLLLKAGLSVCGECGNALCTCEE